MLGTYSKEKVLNRSLFFFCPKPHTEHSCLYIILWILLTIKPKEGCTDENSKIFILEAGCQNREVLVFRHGGIDQLYGDPNESERRDETVSAEVESMFYVRETPWHGLGTNVEEALSSEEAIAAAGLGWDVVQKKIYTEDWGSVPGFYANVMRQRDDLRNRYNHAPDLKDVGKNGYRFINAVSDFATHAKPLRETAGYKENLFLKTMEGNPLIDKAYRMLAA